MKNKELVSFATELKGYPSAVVEILGTNSEEILEKHNLSPEEKEVVLGAFFEFHMNVPEKTTFTTHMLEAILEHVEK